MQCTSPPRSSNEQSLQRPGRPERLDQRRRAQDNCAGRCRCGRRGSGDRVWGLGLGRHGLVAPPEPRSRITSTSSNSDLVHGTWREKSSGLGTAPRLLTYGAERAYDRTRTSVLVRLERRGPPMSEVLLSQLAYVELVSPKPEETVDWMVERARAGGDHPRGPVRLPARLGRVAALEPDRHRRAPSPRSAASAWRTYGPEDPEIIAKRVEGEWVGERPAVTAWLPLPRSGRAAPARGVLGDRALRGADRRSGSRIRCSARRSSRAAAPQARYIDHVTIATPDIHGDIAFYKTLGAAPHRADQPGARLQRLLDDDLQRAPGARTTSASCPDFSGATGRVNHIAYRVDQRLDVERAAEVFMASGTPIEFGPGIHGIDEITYLYVREPGGIAHRDQRRRLGNHDARLGGAGRRRRARAGRRSGRTCRCPSR